MSPEPLESWPLRAADLRRAAPELLKAITRRAKQVCWTCGVRDENQADDVAQAVHLRGSDKTPESACFPADSGVLSEPLKLQEGCREYPDRHRLLAYVTKVAKGYVTAERRRSSKLLPLLTGR